MAKKSSPLAPLLAIAQQGLPFTATDGQAFVRLRLPTGGHYILAVRSRAYRDWFFYRFYAQYDSLPSANAFHAVLNHLEAQANENDHNQHLSVYRRVAAGVNLPPDRITLDLANRQCQIVEISRAGWKTTAGKDALLQTSRSTGPLPVPVSPPPGALPPLHILRSLLNLLSRAGFLRCLAWLLDAFRPYGPYSFLILQGPPSSGKSLAARILRYLIDPSTSPFTATPSSVRELLALARHNWVLAFDHVSSLSPQLTDALCRLSSGLGVAVQETHRSGPDPLQQYYKRPVLLTVTERWSCPAEIAERALVVTLPPLAPECRRPEAALLATFDEARPAILAELCTAVSTALDRLNSTGLPAGRCADTLAWAMAASPALRCFKEGEVCSEEEMRAAFAPPAPPHPMVQAVRALLDQRRRWTGTASELQDLLQPALSCHTPKGVSHQLKTCMLTLADHGIELKFRRLHGGTRIIDLQEDSGDAWSPKTAPHASPNSDPSPQPEEIKALKPC